MSDGRQATEGRSERVGYGRPPKHTQFQKGNRAYLHRRGAKARDDSPNRCARRSPRRSRFVKAAESER
jgi:hypothetical protein